MSIIMQSLWIGESLSKLEQLSMLSFLANGHPYHLYTYDDVKNVPNGVQIKDANEIIAKHEIFLSHGSYAHFADWFRWELLYQKGNWWVDTDVVCLKPFDFDEELVCGKETNKRIAIGVLRFPPKHRLARLLADTCAEPNRLLSYDSQLARFRKRVRLQIWGNKRSNISWGEAGGPTGFTKALHHLGLFENSQPIETFYPVPHNKWREYFSPNKIDYHAQFPNSYAIHYWHEMTKKQRSFNKDADFPKTSIIEQLKDRYMKEAV